VRQLVYLAAVRRDLADIQRYIACRSGSLVTARRFVDLLRQQCRKLASLPGTLGRARPELRHDIRSFAFQKDVIFFRDQDDTLKMVNILEGHCDVIACFGDNET
jgi:plasmid stabilization system protein ParE